ncbi:hypothetical protein GA0061102_103416 [Rhizobium miluonense]|uniref:Uncharacterized protein n=1 Tax=Rhizobium miluonense TaxID=411945 RepID=A0A1C3WN36_9HYPH|nr:hypothetical protein GA0061102_103416 [Rhizobium miluonense]
MRTFMMAVALLGIVSAATGASAQNHLATFREIAAGPLPLQPSRQWRKGTGCRIGFMERPSNPWAMRSCSGERKSM